MMLRLLSRAVLSPATLYSFSRHFLSAFIQVAKGCLLRGDDQTVGVTLEVFADLCSVSRGPSFLPLDFSGAPTSFPLLSSLPPSLPENALCFRRTSWLSPYGNRLEAGCGRIFFHPESGLTFRRVEIYLLSASQFRHRPALLC